MQALVTGGSGFLGRLEAALGAQGFNIRALVRSEDASAGIRGAAPGCDVDFAFGDVTDADSLRRAAAGCEMVFHRFVYVSTTSVYGWDRLLPVDDTMPAQPASAYPKPSWRPSVSSRGGAAVLASCPSDDGLWHR